VLAAAEELQRGRRAGETVNRTCLDDRGPGLTDEKRPSGSRESQRTRR
jgi:hypothetical protein